MSSIVKPFTILNTRASPDGGTEVLFRGQRTVVLDELNTTVETLEMTLFVSAEETVDEVIYSFLSKGGWT